MGKIKPVTKTNIMIDHIKEVYGAMHHGIQVFLKDGTIWSAYSFTIGRLTIKGEFTKCED